MDRDERQPDGLPAKVATLSDMVGYQDGSVVSRTLLDKPTGSVTLFAFDAGQGLSEHTAPFDALVYIADGRAEVTISGASHDVQAGEMIIMPANEPHSLGAPEKFKMVLVMIRS
jgi:quercetin dioxygenase-like cupin family protein